MPSLVAKISVVQKHTTGTVNKSLEPSPHCDLDLEHSIHKTLWVMMMHHQTKFDCKRISGSEDVVETIIF